MQTLHHSLNLSFGVLGQACQSVGSDGRPCRILEEIVWHKVGEIAQLCQDLPLDDLQQQVAHAPAPRDFLAALRQGPVRPSLIAEVKKASPSRGILRPAFDPVAIAQAYVRGGVTCLSVLTDQKFFQGSFNNLRAVRQHVELPLLCKDFIIEPYQIYLARTNGADAVLLIAAILSDQALQEFLQITHCLGMNALVEVHTLAELDRVLALPDVRLVGINNRNLEDFKVDLGTTQKLLAERRARLNSLDIMVVSESGLHTPTDLAVVTEAGAHAVLIGESLVKRTHLEQAAKHLLDSRLNPLHCCQYAGLTSDQC
jgi:indole-3-glycerol phosphate synthase